MIEKSQKILVFPHIAKTAGSALLESLRDCCAPNGIYRWTRGDLPTQNFPEEEFEGVEIIMGHMPYGLHEKIPQSASYYVMLREPIDRVVSYYYYIRRYQDHPQHEFANSPGMTLANFIRARPRGEASNLMVRQLAGSWNFPEEGAFPGVYEQAVHNLKTMPCIGIMEMYHDSLALLAAVHPWKKLCSRKVNVTSDRPRASQISPEERELVRQHNTWDIKLYDAALKQFAATIRKNLPGFIYHHRRIALRNLVRNRVIPLLNRET